MTGMKSGMQLYHILNKAGEERKGGRGGGERGEGMNEGSCWEMK